MSVSSVTVTETMSVSGDGSSVDGSGDLGNNGSGVDNGSDVLGDSGVGRDDGSVGLSDHGSAISVTVSVSKDGGGSDTVTVSESGSGGDAVAVSESGGTVSEGTSLSGGDESGESEGL